MRVRIFMQNISMQITTVCTCSVKVQSGYQSDLSVFKMLEGVNIPFSNTGFCLGSASVPRELILSTKRDVSGSCLNTSVGDEKPALMIFQEKDCGTHSV